MGEIEHRCGKIDTEDFAVGADLVHEVRKIIARSSTKGDHTFAFFQRGGLYHACFPLLKRMGHLLNIGLRKRAGIYFLDGSALTSYIRFKVLKCRFMALGSFVVSVQAQHRPCGIVRLLIHPAPEYASS